MWRSFHLKLLHSCHISSSIILIKKMEIFWCKTWVQTVPHHKSSTHCLAVLYSVCFFCVTRTILHYMCQREINSQARGASVILAFKLISSHKSFLSVSKAFLTFCDTHPGLVWLPSPCWCWKKKREREENPQTWNQNGNSARHCHLLRCNEELSKGIFEEAKGLLMNRPFIDL